MKRFITTMFLLLFVPSLHAQSVESLEFNFSPNIKRFLTQCSGVPESGPQSEMIAYVSCMGLTRGLVDGHTLTMRSYQVRKEEFESRTVTQFPTIGFKQLWCVPQTTSNGQLLATVMVWITINSERVEQLNKKFSTPTQISMATLFAALHDEYPCK